MKFDSVEAFADSPAEATDAVVKVEVVRLGGTMLSYASVPFTTGLPPRGSSTLFLGLVSIA